MRVATYLVCGLFAATASTGERPTPSVDEILAKAIERQRHHEEARHETLFDYELSSVTEKLDKNGDVEKTERERYQSHHLGGVAYERLTEKDGRPLTEEEEKNEHKRAEKFRKKISEGKARHNDSDERVAFDNDLIARYDFTYQDTRPIDGRAAFVLEFAPKQGELPKTSKIDGVLNKASGVLFVDTETFEIARLEFDLNEKVRLWWGMLGSVTRMTGTLERRPVDSEVWLPHSFDFYMRGRVVFRSLHLRQQVRWNEFKRRGPSTTTAHPVKESEQ